MMMRSDNMIVMPFKLTLKVMHCKIVNITHLLNHFSKRENLPIVTNKLTTSTNKQQRMSVQGSKFEITVHF